MSSLGTQNLQHAATLMKGMNRAGKELTAKTPNPTGNMGRANGPQSSANTGKVNFADMAEEASFMFSKDVQREKAKSLAGRAFGSASVQKRVDDIQKLREVYEEFDTMDDGKNLEDQAELIYQNARQGKSIDLSDSDTPSGSYIILKEALNIAIKRNDDKARAIIEKAIDALDSKQGQKIDVDLNTAHTFRQSYPQNRQREAMRHIYYQKILGKDSLGDIMRTLLNTFGKGGLLKSMGTLSEAVLEDLNSQRPSSNPQHLSMRLHDLNGVNTTRAIINGCRDFLGKHKKGTTPSDDQAITLTETLLKLTGGTVFANDLDNIAGQYAKDKRDDSKLSFLNSFYQFLCDQPQQLWSNTKARFTGLQTMLAHMEGMTQKLEIAPKADLSAVKAMQAKASGSV